MAVIKSLLNTAKGMFKSNYKDLIPGIKSIGKHVSDRNIISSIAESASLDRKIISNMAKGGYKVGNAILGKPTGILGGAAGGVMGVGTYTAGRVMQGIWNAGIRAPVITGGIAVGGLTTASFSKGFMGNPMRNRPTNPAIPASQVQGPGFVQLNNPRVRMSGGHLGATGDLSLSLHRLRHGNK